MKACKPLEEYSWLVEAVRRYQTIKKDIEQAVDCAISEMPDDFLIKKFLIANKAEVKGMLLTEWDQEKVLAQAVNDDRRRVATDMLKENLPIPLIAKISKLSEEAVLKLANTLGVTVM